MDILSKIVAQKRAEIAAAEQARPLAHVRALAERNKSRRRPFCAPLMQPGPQGVNVIAEIKRASPSKGMIRGDLDPAYYASAYERGGAQALSVLTDRTFFQGSLADLQAARAATRLPVLRKEFIITDYQLYESAAAGADAVLLIVRILETRQLSDLASLCRELELDALVEIHSAEEIEAAERAGARLIGINNRNLKTFDTQVGRAVQLNRLLAPGQVAVAASGIQDRRDVRATLAGGIWNFLIGESLVRAPDPEARLRRLIGE